MYSKTQEKIQKWVKIIKDCESSGIGVYDWCKNNNISISTFYFWKKKIKNLNKNCNFVNKLVNQSFSLKLGDAVAVIKTNNADILLYSGIDDDLLQKILTCIT